MKYFLICLLFLQSLMAWGETVHPYVSFVKKAFQVNEVDWPTIVTLQGTQSDKSKCIVKAELDSDQYITLSLGHFIARNGNVYVDAHKTQNLLHYESRFNHCPNCEPTDDFKVLESNSHMMHVRVLEKSYSQDGNGPMSLSNNVSEAKVETDDRGIVKIVTIYDVQCTSEDWISCTAKAPFRCELN